MGKRHTPTMPMDMDVAGEQGRIAKQRRIEPIAGRIRSMVMVMGKPVAAGHAKPRRKAGLVN